MTISGPESDAVQHESKGGSGVEGVHSSDNPSSFALPLMRSILRIPVTLKVVVGSATLPVSTLAALHRGSIIKLDRGVADKVDVIANGRVIARGEIVVLDDSGSRYGVAIDEIIAEPSPR